MRHGWHAAALVLLAACRISDLSFYQPGDAGDTGGTGGTGGDAGIDMGNMTAPDAAAPVFPSCKDLQAQCGVAADSCCTSLDVPRGTFYRDHDVAGDTIYGGTTFQAMVSAFRLDKYDVTVARFRAFVATGKGTRVDAPAAGDGAHPQIPGSGWDPSWNAKLEADPVALKDQLTSCSVDTTWTNFPVSATKENRPINCITWYEAMAFCIWDGGYLPTELEWNYAALGGDEQRAYPWSSPAGALTIGPSYASYSPDNGTSCPQDGKPACSVDDIVPVGSFPGGEGRWHQADLAGNMSQWMLDWYEPYPASCPDCANTVLTGGNPEIRSVRGGSFGAGKEHLRGGLRDNEVPTRRNYINAIRCARPPM
jgi:formylglycine-generating enzyme required for sulfatase activity